MQLSNGLEKGLVPKLEASPAEPGVLIVTRADGTQLHPTPTSDALDPLNWSVLRKYTCVFIACSFYFLMTYLSTAPIPSFFLLEEQFDATYNETNWTFAVVAFGFIFGPLFSGGVAETYGRRICMIVCTSISLLATGCTAIKAQNIHAYMFERFLQGLGSGSACNLGLSIINDVSFEHERGLRVGLWALSANLGTLLGGVFGGLVVSVDQFWVPYHVAMAFAVLLLLEIFLLPETLYPRSHVLHAESDGGAVEDFPRTRTLPFLNFETVPRVSHPALYAPWVVVYKLCAYPDIVISIVAYVFGQYWWFVAMMTMEPAAYEDRSPQIQGVLFLGFLVGVLFAECFCSGHMSDKIVKVLAARNGQERQPEMRLWLGFPAAALSAVGCILWGISVDRDFHWAVGQVAFFLYALGLQVGNTVLSAYMLDNYPAYATELSIFYGCIINLSAFLVPWFIYTWADTSGYTWCFAVQGILCVVVVMPAYAVLLKFGGKWRKPPQFGRLA